MFIEHQSTSEPKISVTDTLNNRSCA